VRWRTSYIWGKRLIAVSPKEIAHGKTVKHFQIDEPDWSARSERERAYQRLLSVAQREEHPLLR
jgi:hypothetical protein